jgi:hypothetical protein
MKEEGEARRWQFGIAHLLGVMTWACVAAALVAGFGPGTLMMSAGLLLAWLNYCGAFASLQSGRRQTAVLWTAWGLFLVSLALPCLGAFGMVLGYAAAWFVLSGPFMALSRGEWQHPQLLLLIHLSAANVLILCTPFLIWRLRSGRGQGLSATLCLAMIGPWSIIWDSPGLLVGYFVWCASFGLALVALPVRRGVLVAMVVTAVAIGVMIEWNQMRLFGP